MAILRSLWRSLNNEFSPFWLGELKTSPSPILALRIVHLLPTWQSLWSFAWWLSGKESACNARGTGSIPGKTLPVPVVWLKGFTVICSLKLICAPLWSFPGLSQGKESACSAGDPGSIPWLGRTPGEGDGYPLQYPCLENSMDREAWPVTSIGSQRVRNDWSNVALPVSSFYLPPVPRPPPELRGP